MILLLSIHDLTDEGMGLLNADPQHGIYRITQEHLHKGLHYLADVSGAATQGIIVRHGFQYSIMRAGGKWLPEPFVKDIVGLCNSIIAIQEDVEIYPTKAQDVQRGHHER